ncbi:hypothetical protein D3C71_1992080 [compost metagenome]
MWLLIIPWTTLNPRPEPSPIGFVVKNGSNILDFISSGIPLPWSAISIKKFSGSELTFTVIRLFFGAT